jgi:hypothetical protein
VAVRLILIATLPFITLALGLVSTFNDVRKNRKAAILLLVMMVASTIGTLVSSYQDYKDKQADAAASATQRAVDSRRIDKLLDEAASSAITITDLVGKTSDIKGATTAVAQGMTSLLKRFGILPGAAVTSETLNTSVAADKTYTTLLPTVRAEGQGTQRVVTYFPKDVDSGTVLAALRDGNFTVHKAKGNPNNINLPTNAVWVGESLSVNDAKFVAATLIRAGVPIIAVRRLTNSSSGPRASLVEVGSDSLIAGQPPMTIERLNALTDADLRR